jgi:hypothetical protein
MGIACMCENEVLKIGSIFEAYYFEGIFFMILIYLLVEIVEYQGKIL